MVIPKGKQRDLIREGVYNAVCCMIIDLGVQYDEYYEKSQRKVRLFWELVGETYEINGEKVPRRISKKFTLSLDEKSNLRRVLESWRGKAFKPEDIQTFDLRNILNVGCQIQIVHKNSQLGTYADVNAIIPSLTKLPPVQKTICFDFDDEATYPEFEDLPRYLQEVIAQAENFVDTGLVLPSKKAPANPNISESVPLKKAPVNPNISDSVPPVTAFDDFDEIGSNDDLPF